MTDATKPTILGPDGTLLTSEELGIEGVAVENEGGGEQSFKQTLVSLVPPEIQLVDEEGKEGYMRCVVTRTGVLFHGGCVWAANAFDKFVAGKSWESELGIALNRNHWQFMPVGRFINFWMNGNALMGEAMFSLNSDEGKNAYGLVKDKALRGLSVEATCYTMEFPKNKTSKWRVRYTECGVTGAALTNIPAIRTAVVKKVLSEGGDSHTLQTPIAVSFLDLAATKKEEKTVEAEQTEPEKPETVSTESEPESTPEELTADAEPAEKEAEKVETEKEPEKKPEVKADEESAEQEEVEKKPEVEKENHRGETRTSRRERARSRHLGPAA